MSRRALILRLAVAPACLLIGLVLIALGALNATIWKPSDRVSAQTRVPSSNRYVVSDPGVLSLVGSNASLSVRSSQPDHEVCIATGNARDVTGWIEGSPYTRLTGLSDWSTLSTGTASASGNSPDAQNAVAFQDSDLWNEVTCKDGSVALSQHGVSSSDVAVIDLGEDPSGATVDVRWERSSLPDFATPLYFAGGLLVIASVLLATVFASAPERRRKRVTSRAHVRRHEEVPLLAAFTGSISLVAAALASVGGSKSRHRRRGTHTGIVPAAASQQTNDSAMPTIVDPASRNIVDDVQQAVLSPGEHDKTVAASAAPPSGKATEVADGDADDADLSEISPQELLGYLARLSREDLPDMQDTVKHGRHGTQTKQGVMQR